MDDDRDPYGDAFDECECSHDREAHDMFGTFECEEQASSGHRCSCPGFKCVWP